MRAVGPQLVRHVGGVEFGDDLVAVLDVEFGIEQHHGRRAQPGRDKHKESDTGDADAAEENQTGEPEPLEGLKKCIHLPQPWSLFIGGCSPE